MARAMSAKQIISLRRETIDLGGVWKDCVGAMDRRCVVFVWGNSGNGKTSAVMSLCRELCAKGLRGIYLSLEEGFSVSMQDTLRRFGMEECGSLFKVAESCSMTELTDRLARRRSEDFFVIDSIQYLRLTYRQYVFIKTNWPNKLFILVSHADGRQPEGRSARSIMYDSALKIWVEGYAAFSKGRFIGSTGKAVIWEKGARDYWGEDMGRTQDDENDNQ